MSQEWSHSKETNAGSVDKLVWRIFREAGTIITHGSDKPFTFATGELATVKVDAELLQDNPTYRGAVLGMMALHSCVQTADTLVGIPNGMTENAEILGDLLKKPVISLRRPKKEQRYKFEFTSPADEANLLGARRICLLEDVSRTGSTAWHVAKFLRQSTPNALDTHSLAMLQRGEVDQEYKDDSQLAYHWLCRRDMPLDAIEFAVQYGFAPDLIEV